MERCSIITLVNLIFFLEHYSRIASMYLISYRFFLSKFYVTDSALFNYLQEIRCICFFGNFTSAWLVLLLQ